MNILEVEKNETVVFNENGLVVVEKVFSGEPEIVEFRVEGETFFEAREMKRESLALLITKLVGILADS